MARVDIFVLFFEYDVSLWVCKWPFYVEIYSLYTNFHESFIMNWWWILPNAFSASIEMIKWFLVFLWLMWHITLINLWMVNHLYIPEMNPILSERMIMLMYFWIPFTNILLSNSTSMFTRYIVIFFFGGIFVWFWSQVL